MAGLHAGAELFPGQCDRRLSSGEQRRSLPQRALHHHNGRLLMRVLLRLLRNKRASAGPIAAVYRRAADKGGAAAVEFAMLLPIMITLFFGVVETSLALLCRADVSVMASTAADLV